VPDQPDPNKGWTPIQDAQNAASLFVLAAQVMAAPVEVFLRKRFGRRYHGVPAFLGLLAVPMWMLLWPQEDFTPIFVFWGLLFLMQLRARIESLVMVAKGELVHTRYNGYPRLARIFKNTNEQKIKGKIEPVFVMIAGAALLAVSEPLGSFLIVSGLSLAIVAGVIESVERNRTLSMHDAWLEQQDQASRFREIKDR
jgi:hypothetical protein